MVRLAIASLECCFFLSICAFLLVKPYKLLDKLTQPILSLLFYSLSATRTTVIITQVLFSQLNADELSAWHCICGRSAKNNRIERNNSKVTKGKDDLVDYIVLIDPHSTIVRESESQFLSIATGEYTNPFSVLAR